MIGAQEEYKTRECNVTKTEKRRKKPKKVETTDVEEYLKQLPLPPEEHTYELKMEKLLKRMVEKQEKKKTKKDI